LVDAEGKVTTDFRSAERLRADGVPKRIPLPVERQR
jgi:hypothetical protein